ncbi:MAG: hypothetical protein WBP81_00230, partial [Solirubrobacteraceae bacterium]
MSGITQSEQVFVYSEWSLGSEFSPWPLASMVDTIGLLVIVMITAANVQDRDGARPVLAAVRKAFPTISLVWA